MGLCLVMDEGEPVCELVAQEIRETLKRYIHQPVSKTKEEAKQEVINYLTAFQTPGVKDLQVVFNEATQQFDVSFWYKPCNFS